MAPYKWTDGELVTAEKLNAYSEGMERIKTDTEAAQAAAETARDTAEAKATAAGQSAQSAENAKASAEEKANVASISASNAETSATDAATSATAAEAAKTAAETAKSDAQTAATDASESKTAAEQSAMAAAQSAESATQSASSAESDATAALQSKEAAALSEANAAGSETAAAESAAAALGNKNAAAESASAAATSETNAATSAAEAQAAQNAAEAARDQAQSIVGGDFANHTLVTIPVGRMRGDVDGDGKLTHNASNPSDPNTDYYLIVNNGNHPITDEIALWCADVTIDGDVNDVDAQQIQRFVSGMTNILTSRPTFADYYNNWTYEKIDDLTGQFYTDIPITGMTANHSASVIVKGTYESGFFPKAECISGAIRIYAKLCPIEALTAVVSWGTGDGTAVITTESEDLTVYDAHIADADIHVTAEEKAVWNTDKVFIAIYGTTTFKEIETAFKSGKNVILVTNGDLTSGVNDIYVLSRYLSNAFYFGRIVGSDNAMLIETVRLNNSLGWTKTAFKPSFYDINEEYYFRSISPSYNDDGTFKSLGFKFKNLDESITALKTINVPVLPAVTTADNGKILQVVDGVWTAVTPS